MNGNDHYWKSNPSNALEKIKVIITGAGAPGIQGTIYSLRYNYDKRDIHLTGTDVNDFVSGKYLCDDFYVISPARERQRYLHDLLDICVRQKIHIILPQNTAELCVLAENKELFKENGVKIAVSGYRSIVLANDKFKLFEVADRIGIPVSRSFLVSDFRELKKRALQIGWPNEKFVVKPPVSNGSRGVRIVTENFDRKKAFYEEKPSALYTNLDELYSVLGDEFPELIVMEYLPGEEYTVDVFRYGKHLVSIPRKRVVIRSGITFAAGLEKNETLIAYSNQLAEATDLQYCFGFQYKLNRHGVPFLLESNPRIQGTMVMSALADANIIYSSVKALLDEDLPPFRIKWETRLLRYWGAIGINNHGITKI